MKKRFFAMLFVVLLLTVGVTAVVADTQATVMVGVTNFAFTPNSVTIDVGDTVQWDNTDGFHNVAFLTGPVTPAGNSPGSGWTHSETFNTAGVYTYQCDIHTSMTGTVTVEAPPPIPDVKINEIRIDQSGSDDDEYFELYLDFAPVAASSSGGVSLDGLTYLVIGDGAGGGGVIEHVTDLTGQVMGSEFFVAAEGTFTIGTANMTTSLNFENGDNVTHVLVAGFTGALDDDLDIDDDGTLDVLPWSTVLDAVSLLEEANPPTGTEFGYAAALGGLEVGPDGSFVPAHVFRLPDGTGSWNIGEFSTAPPEADDTPGATNAQALAVGMSGIGTVNNQTPIVLILFATLTLAVVSIRAHRRS